MKKEKCLSKICEAIMNHYGVEMVGSLFLLSVWLF